ncbi:RNA polymerase sigma factor [Arenibacter sp. N53]|uniref:RNA polymerase sigma factor n=1 Tax=Arenibacter TaxID=178469 RepID=UPI000CD4670E|nr:MULTISPECIES: RNA polymerase sigma factor [Arenibacter]MCM4152821.1 RNA polymerase sigma factor [Arenibacter sp. N53]
MSKELHEDICQQQIFSGIYNKYSKNLHDYLYYKYGTRLNPADKAQEAFIKLWENCKKVTLGKAKSYLYTVANNMMLNEVKHQKIVLQYQKIQPAQYSNETPEFLMEKEEYFQKYQKALENLSQEQRVAFMLNKAEGKKHEEIAEMLGVTRKVVEYRIYTAFSILKKELENFKLK